MGARDEPGEGDPTFGYNEEQIELARRGEEHFLEGLGKGARAACRKWREGMANT